jgi:peptidoglycan/xylan/chitin deacetylase (PgdA/CDA1 family)
MTWDMDADSAFNWYNKETADNLVAAQSWTRYDPLIAIPRLVEQFARLGLHLTFFVPGWVIEKYPAQIDLLLKNGHEIALHGYLHERSNEIANDDEAPPADLGRRAFTDYCSRSRSLRLQRPAGRPPPIGRMPASARRRRGRIHPLACAVPWSR